MRPEFRRDPLHNTWVVFSPERQNRPQDFQTKTPAAGTLDPFTAGHEALTPPEVYALRAPGTEPNSPGWQVRVVPNRFPALRIEGQTEANPDGPYDRISGIGAHEVIIETPESDQALEDLPQEGIASVLATYRARILDLNQDGRFQLIYIFKNVGPLAGASLSHAHSQLVALPIIPPTVEAKLQRAKDHYQRKQRSLFSDIIYTERQDELRLVAENESFVLFCPYASRFAFEMAIFPKRHHPDYATCGDSELLDLAEVLRFALTRLNKVLEEPGYNLLLHTAPLHRPGPDGTFCYASSRVDYSWHIEIIPRIASIAGFELGLGSYINTVFPEDAARFLRGEVQP